MYTDLIPMLNVSDIRQSLKFYKDVLNFERVSSDDQLREWRWARLVCDDIDFMLMETSADHDFGDDADYLKNVRWPSMLYFHVDNLDGLYAKAKHFGLNVSPLRRTKFGLEEFSVKDPDGHLLSFGRDLLDENDNLIG